MDNLEKFIKDNRDGFDPDLPNDIWDKVEKDLDQTSSKPALWKRLVPYAAVVAVTMGASYLFMQSDDEVAIQPGQMAIEVAPPEEINLGEISPEYAEIEQHYAIQVSHKMDELSTLDPDNEFVGEIRTLDEEYEFLKKELGAGGDDEVIIQAMIENYRLKLEVLEDILSHLKEIDDENTGVEI